jgi:hypothetical protein
MQGPPVATCANHAEREALGVCVHCRKLVCAECVTRVDGINYCVGCLEVVGASRKSVRPARTSRAAEIVSTMLLAGLLALSVFALLLVVFPL